MDGTLQVPISGLGIEPEIAVTPTSNVYGELRLTEALAQTYWIRNEGTADLAVPATTIVGADQDGDLSRVGGLSGPVKPLALLPVGRPR